MDAYKLSVQGTVVIGKLMHVKWTVCVELIVDLEIEEYSSENRTLAFIS